MASKSTSGGEGNEEKKDSASKPKQDFSSASRSISPVPLIDALQKRYPMSFNEERYQRWLQKLKQEDLEFISDLLVDSNALRTHNGRYTTGLYGLLTNFKEKCTVIEVRFRSAVEGTIPVKDIEGYYIDCGDMVNGHRVLVNVKGGGFESDPSQFVIYHRKAKRVAIHRVQSMVHDHCWIQSNETLNGLGTVFFKDLTWQYWAGKEIGMQPVTLKITQWN